jgi:hypothetical protein
MHTLIIFVLWIHKIVVHKILKGIGCQELLELECFTFFCVWVDYRKARF